MGTQAEKRVDEELLTDCKRVTGKTRLLFQMAAEALAHPAEAVQEVLSPVVGVETLRHLVTEGAATGHFDRDNVQRVMQLPIRSINSSYSEFQATGRDAYPTPAVAGWLPAPLTRASSVAGFPLRRHA